MCRSAPGRTELLPKKPDTFPPFCHSDRSVSGVEESTTWQKVPTQGKICHSGRFLDSLRSLGMTCRGAVPVYLHRLYSPRNGTAHRPFPTVRLGRIPFAPVVSAMHNAALPRHALPLPMGEVAERKRGRRGSTLRILMDVIIQKKRPRALSVSAAPSQLSQRESQEGAVCQSLYRMRPWAWWSIYGKTGIFA